MVYMTRGWGEIARVGRTGGALVIHLKYDDASLMFFKVFDTEGRRLECCPEKGGRGPAAARTRLANRFPSSSLGSGGVGGSSDSAELLMTPETSDDSYEPPSLRRSRSRVGSSRRRRH